MDGLDIRSYRQEEYGDQMKALYRQLYNHVYAACWLYPQGQLPGPVLAAGGAAGDMRLLSTKCVPLRSWRAHRGHIAAVADVQGKYVATGGQDGAVKLWDAGCAGQAGEMGNDDTSFHAGRSPCEKPQLEAYLPTYGCGLAARDAVGQVTAVQAAGGSCYAGSGEGVLYHMDLTAPTLERFSQASHDCSITDIALSSTSIVATCSNDGSVHLHDARTSAAIRPPSAFQAAIQHPSQPLLNTSQPPGGAPQAATAQQGTHYAGTPRAKSLSFSKDGNWLLVGLSSGQIYFWDLVSDSVSLGADLGTNLSAIKLVNGIIHAVGNSPDIARFNFQGQLLNRIHVGGQMLFCMDVQHHTNVVGVGGDHGTIGFVNEQGMILAVKGGPEIGQG